MQGAKLPYCVHVCLSFERINGNTYPYTRRSKIFSDKISYEMKYTKHTDSKIKHKKHTDSKREGCHV